MWQSWVENAIAYFDHTHVFKALYLRTSVKGWVHTCCVEVSYIDTTTQRV